MIGNGAGRPIVVVGAGIVGLATALTILRRRPGTSLMVLEKEPRAAHHQTGHNSGVVHSGIYYRPGSLKARLCLRGRGLLLDYFRSHGVPFKVCGKVIVASRPTDLPRLRELGHRARENGVPGVRSLTPGELRELEPEAVGLAALHVPGTGIVDYGAVARSFVAEIERGGGEVRTGCEVTAWRSSASGVELRTRDGTIDAAYVVNAAGLQADRLARRAGVDPGCTIVPFRGEHYTLAPRGASLVRGLVYPVPDPELPFLGVHLTPHVDGSVEAGPNAVLALAREGYRRSDVAWRDLAETALYPGFVRMVRRYWRTSVRETLRSLSRSLFLDDLRRLVPALGPEDLVGWGAGVRAQALSPSGDLVDDFLLVGTPRTLHVLNAPSPAATSSLAIAEELVRRIPGMAS